MQVACAVVLALILLHPMAQAAIAPAFTDADWHSFGPTNNGAYTVDGSSGELLAGGVFTQLGGVALPYVGRWDGQAWSPLGSGPGYGVDAFATDGTTIYAVWGNSRKISRWNGADWTEIGSANGTIYDLVMMGGKLYAGGYSAFTEISGVPVNRIACWDGTAWAAVGSGVNNTITAMSASGSSVLVSGTFTTAGGNPAAGVASWDGSTWTGYPASTSNYMGFTVLNAAGDFYVGRDTIERWTGSGWAVLGTFDATVKAIAMHGGKLYVGGSFTHVDGVAANYIAVWNGSVWSAIGSGTNRDVRKMSVVGNNLAVAGTFTRAGGTDAEYIAMLDLDGDSGAPSAPIDVDPSAIVLHPPVAIGTALGITARAADPDLTPVVYHLSNDAGGKVAIDAHSGVITAAQALGLGTYAIGVQASDGFHSSALSSFTIQVDNPPGVPVDADATANRVSPMAPVGGAVGITGQASDLDGTTLHYSLTDTAGGRFAINATTGVVRVAAALGSPAVRQIIIQADDGILTSQATFTITIDDPPSAPSDINATANQIVENAVPGRSVGLTVVSTDPNGGAVTYSLSDDASGRFAIDTITGIVTVAAALGAPASRSITVVASDGMLSTSASFTIVVTANQAPSLSSDIDSEADAVAASAPIGTSIRLTAHAVDPDGSTVTYSLSDADGGRFAINAASGVVTVAAALGDPGVRSITVVASDGVLSSSVVFAIAVVNQAPTAPVDTDAAVNAVATVAVPGTTVGIIARSTDADPGSVVTYRLSDNAGGLFAIHPSLGIVTVALALGPAATHRITVEATDSWATASASFDIVVTPEGGDDGGGCGGGAIGSIGLAVALGLRGRRSRG